MANYLWIIPAAPLLAFIITLLFGKSVLRSQAHWPGIIGVGISFIGAILTFFNVQSLAPGDALNDRLFTWMNTGAYDFDSLQLKVAVNLRADHLTGLML